MNPEVFDIALAPVLTDLVRQARERGFQTPLTLVLVGKDGASVVLRHTPPDDGPEQFAQQIGSTPWAFPLNVLIADSRGAGAVVTLRAEQFAKH